MNEDWEDYKIFILISLAFHLILALIFSVKVLIFPGHSEPLEKTLRVDMVALPEMNPTPPKVIKPIEDPAKVAVPPPKVEEARPSPKEEKVALAPQLEEKKKSKKKKDEKKEKKKKAKEPKKDSPKIKNSQNSALARLRALKKIKDQQNQAVQEKLKGNEVSKGLNLEGVQKIQHSSYQAELTNHIQSFWHLPEWMAKKDWKATVLIIIDKEGKIKSKKFVVNSGNEDFDQQVLGTLEKANPLPPPPESLVSYYFNQGIKVNFPD